jgi:hypothetical protein
VAADRGGSDYIVPSSKREKNIGKSKRKQLTTGANRDKGSKKDEKTAPKRKGPRNPRGANRHGK